MSQRLIDVSHTVEHGMITYRGFPAPIICGKWSHCGVDTFTLVTVADRWRIATLSFSLEQPPACERHPAGPPKP